MVQVMRCNNIKMLILSGMISLGAAVNVATTALASDIDDANNRAQADVYGDWVPPDMDAVIRVGPCAFEVTYLCAHLVKHAYESLSDTDVLNPDPELKSRELIGVNILTSVRPTSDTRWKDGDLYDPRTGKSYYAKVKLLGKDSLKITGCLGPGLCKGYVWHRFAPGQSLVKGGTVPKSPANHTLTATRSSVARVVKEVM